MGEEAKCSSFYKYGHVFLDAIWFSVAPQPVSSAPFYVIPSEAKNLLLAKTGRVSRPATTEWLRSSEKTT